MKSNVIPSFQMKKKDQFHIKLQKKIYIQMIKFDKTLQKRIN